MIVDQNIKLTCQSFINNIDREAPRCERAGLRSRGEHNPDFVGVRVEVGGNGGARRSDHHRVPVVGVLTITGLQEIQSLTGAEVGEDDAHSPRGRDADQPATEAAGVVLVGVVGREDVVLPVDGNLN